MAERPADTPHGEQKHNYNRRRLLQTLGSVGGIAMIAGCGSGGSGDSGGNGDGGDGDSGGDSDGGGSNGGGNEELGERVPTINFEYWTGFGATSRAYENMSPIVADGWEELGLDVSIQGREYGVSMEDVTQDQRFGQHFFGHGPDMARLDPQELMARQGIHRAGGNGTDNLGNYANCEYTDLFFQQAQATSLENRHELVNRAEEIRTHDYSAAPVGSRMVFGAYNQDNVEIGGVGNLGISWYNPHILRKSAPVGKDTIVYSGYSGTLQTLNYYSYTTTAALSLWKDTVNSPLVQYSEEFDLVNVLAESVEEQNEGTEVVVTLRDSATFHNGDPVTAEDVKFTYEHIRNNLATYPKATTPAYNSIEITDDKTVTFVGDEPFPALRTRVMPYWGILHRQSWVEAGALDNPSDNFPDEVIGSGPFQLESISPGQAAELVPHEGHALRGRDGWTPEHNLIYTPFSSSEAQFQAFSDQSVDIIPAISATDFNRAGELSFGQATSATTHTPFYVCPEYPMAPSKFRPFRKAMGMTIDRNEINQLQFQGRNITPTDAEIFVEGHPFRPPEDMIGTYTDDPSGDVEGARQHLEENGWGWDDDGRLHYPPDADLSPLWPEGEVPQPESFPCMQRVEEDGEEVIQYVRPSNRS